jgi:DNA-binding NarL/FixJ family response regulator
MRAQKVISVDGNPELLWLRNAVLKYEGFQVVTSLRHEDALAEIRRGDCGTLLMCYSMPRSSRQLLAEAFRQYCPGGRIVAITNEQMDKAEFADSFVYGVEGPEALIEVIRQHESPAGA